MPQFHTCNSLFLINREYFNGCMLRLVSNSPWIQTQSRPPPPRLLSVLFMQICIKFFQENIFLLHVTCCVQICKPPTTNTTDLLLNCEILCNMMFARVCVCRVCVCVCVCERACASWLCWAIALPVGGQTDCSVGQQTGVQGTQGTADTLPPPGQWWGTEDTAGGQLTPGSLWETESAPHLASLFRSPTPNVLF